MTNEEITRILARVQRDAQFAAFTPPAMCGVASTVFLGLSFVDNYFYFITFPLLLVPVGAGAMMAATRRFKARESESARLIWQTLGETGIFGAALPKETRQLGGNVQAIYALDPKGELLPIRQAMRLVDTHRRQQERLQIVNARLGELRALREVLIHKIAQLQGLGENSPEGKRNLEQVNEDARALREVQLQILSSCYRLEMIAISVQKAAQGRRLHRELGELNANISRSNQLVEPAFEAESLDDIERQIGREIETYLQLERETEAHLR